MAEQQFAGRVGNSGLMVFCAVLAICCRNGRELDGLARASN